MPLNKETRSLNNNDRAFFCLRSPVFFLMKWGGVLSVILLSPFVLACFPEGFHYFLSMKLEFHQHKTKFHLEKQKVPLGGTHRIGQTIPEDCPPDAFRLSARWHQILCIMLSDSPFGSGECPFRFAVFL